MENVSQVLSIYLNGRQPFPGIYEVRRLNERKPSLHHVVELKGLLK